MAVKSKKVKTKAKPKSAPKARAKAKSKPKIKTQLRSPAKGKPVRKTRTGGIKLKETVKPRKAAKPSTAETGKAFEARSRAALTPPAAVRMPVNSPLTAPRMPAAVPVVKRAVAAGGIRPKPVKRTLRPAQYSYMKAPGAEHMFEVGDIVEVFCDHEKNRERVRGWIKGIVVQVDYKMVAVQFRSNVFLTDGWMVPDRILWYPLTSEHIRPVPGKKSAAKKELLPDY